MTEDIDYENIMDEEFLNLSDYDRIKVRQCMKEAVKQAENCLPKQEEQSAATITKVSRLKPSEPDAIFLEQEKSDAIEFAEWISYNNWMPDENTQGLWTNGYVAGDIEDKNKLTRELYTLFKSKTK